MSLELHLASCISVLSAADLQNLNNLMDNGTIDAQTVSEKHFLVLNNINIGKQHSVIQSNVPTDKDNNVPFKSHKDAFWPENVIGISIDPLFILLSPQLVPENGAVTMHKTQRGSLKNRRNTFLFI